MKKTIDKYEFIGTMKHYDFSYDGCVALYEYFMDLEDQMGHEVEFDPIGISYEYTEYESLEQIAKEYGEEYGDIDYLEQSTQVIEFDKGIIILNF